MVASNAASLPAAGRAGVMPQMSDLHRTCAVRLVDRRTGATHRVNGTPLVLFTRNPDEAAAELLQGRNQAVWEVRVDQIESISETGRRK